MICRSPLRFFQIAYRFASHPGVFDFRPCAGSYVSTDVYDIDLVGHVDLAFVHVVQHLLGAFRPDLIIAGVAEEADADDDVALQREVVLSSPLFDDRLKSHLCHTKPCAEFGLPMYSAYEDTVATVRKGEEDLIDVDRQDYTECPWPKSWAFLLLHRTGCKIRYNKDR